MKVVTNFPVTSQAECRWPKGTQHVHQKRMHAQQKHARERGVMAKLAMYLLVAASMVGAGARPISRQPEFSNDNDSTGHFKTWKDLVGNVGPAQVFVAQPRRKVVEQHHDDCGEDMTPLGIESQFAHATDNDLVLHDAAREEAAT